MVFDAPAVYLSPRARRGRIASQVAIRVRGTLHRLSPFRLHLTPTLTARALARAAPHAGRGSAPFGAATRELEFIARCSLRRVLEMIVRCRRVRLLGRLARRPTRDRVGEAIEIEI